MDLPRKNQVSLRGASAREITRDALLEKVSQERELRNYVRRANASALFIQRVWRCYMVNRKTALQLQEEWDIMLHQYSSPTSATWLSNALLRPFLYFTARLLTKNGRIQFRELRCIQSCFTLVLESINSSDPRKNFCSLAIGSLEERRTWNYQAKNLTTLCASILAACDTTDPKILVLTSLAMRLLVALTDPKGWKMVADGDCSDADLAAKSLVLFLGSESGFYVSARKYIMNLDFPVPSQINGVKRTDDRFLITATVITLVLRPFHVLSSDENCPPAVDLHDVAKGYILSLLTVPWLVKRVPPILVPALKHVAVLSPCFYSLQIFGGEILMKMSEMEHSEGSCRHMIIPPVGWALTNIVSLMVGSDSGSLDAKLLDNGMGYSSYVQVVITLSENLLIWAENAGNIGKEHQEMDCNCGASSDQAYAVSSEIEATPRNVNILFVDLLRPLCQQSHLTELLVVLKEKASHDKAETGVAKKPDKFRTLELVDIAYFYSYLVRIFSVYNPVFGSLPVLNMLSFTPGLLTGLWQDLDSYLFCIDSPEGSNSFPRNTLGNEASTIGEKHKQALKGGVSKWNSVLQKFTGKSHSYTENRHVDSADHQANDMHIDALQSEVWDVELLRCGPESIPADMACLLFLFCATYSHLLLVLDDIEFYEKQVPFTLDQQRRITSSLNTFVYNSLSKGCFKKNKHLLECAIKCLHMMYERDCRHQFCPSSLWLSPASQSRLPIAMATRMHEVISTKLDDPLPESSMGSVITTMPHVYPFEERVEMFRDFIKMDKVSRAMTDAGPGSRKVEIVIRRGHVVEDGFRRLNSLGSKLKSPIHVSFVSECGLPEAGLDYGGLSKEFLTDLSKAAFSPEYGLFSQTSTVDRLLIPNPSAKYLENGLQMIEFLGRVVGKALYEGILLDYSFSHVFVQKLLGRYSFLDELSTLDPEMYRNLMYVKHYEGDVKELSLDFTVTEESSGKRHLIELKPGGKDSCVTNENKMQYVYDIADYKLNRQILPFSNAFYRGMTDLIFPSWLKLFNANEFNQLLSGGKHDIDVDDLRSNTQYTGGYSEGNRSVKLFWEVMHSFEPGERCMVLKFVTSCSRAPLLGFKYLQPPFTIHKVSCDVPLWASIGGQDVDRLPSASTCYNTLKLPTYKRASTLRSKLLYAINSNAGFELS